MTRFRSAAQLLLGVFATCAFSTSARASTDTHETARDVRVVVQSDGSALVDETLHIHLFFSGWKGLDVPNVEADAMPEPDATITSLDGGSFPAHLAAVPPNALHLDALEPKAIKKGDYAIHFRYRTSLVANHEVTRDGALWRVSWTSPPVSEGIDGSRVVFDFPAAPTEPSAVDESGAGDASGFLSTLRRASDRDELELVRLHVARGESITWSARIDPKALAEVHDPVLRPPPQPRKVEVDPLARFGGPWRAVLAVLFGVAFCIVGASRLRRVVGAKSSLKSLIFLHPLFAMFLASVVYGVGVWLELVGSPRAAVAVFAAASIATMLRVATKKQSPRGPGNWKTLSEDALFDPADARAAFDVSTMLGKISLGAVLAGATMLTFALRSIDPNAWLIVAPMTIPWLSFWFSGAASSEPDARAAARELRSIFRSLRKSGARVVPWGRAPIGRHEVDDLRLLVVPDAALPGLVGIEIAVAWLASAGGFTPRFELFVRARDASAAAGKMSSLSRAIRTVTGRRPEERVYLLSPRDMTDKSAIALVDACTRELVDRRLVVEKAWAGNERRKPLKNGLIVNQEASAG
jgi:hypothetical protein